MRCLLVMRIHSISLRCLALSFCSIALATAIKAGEAVLSAKAPKNPVAPIEAVEWKVNPISPVATPIFFENPIIRSETRPLFARHRIDPGFVTGDGDAQLYAVQLRYAITSRFTFDGSIRF